MLARVKALLRRPRLYAAEDSVIGSGAVTIHRAEHRVFIKGKATAKLSPKEFALLTQLVLHAPKVLDKSTLALKAWGISLERLHHRTLDVHILRIRKKLGASARYLVTVPSIGYQWAER
jgi:two-component system phosphate regulon response regulator PhoB